MARMTAATVFVLLASIMTAPAASAHGEGETEEGYLLLQQALGHLAHDTSADGIDLAMEKVQDALDTEDQEGVDVAEVQQGMAALEAGDADRARTLLQDSIAAALRDLPPATGNQTGTTLVTPELPGRTGLHGQDWIFLVLSLGIGAVGVWLSILFRPSDNVRALRTRLAADASRAGDSPPDQEGR